VTDTPPRLSRRTVLAAGAAGATLVGTTIAFSPADARGAAGEKVFQHGTASGDRPPGGYDGHNRL
jgi:phosphodiesterase/alkaline phosphatase D-like protein